MGARQRIGVVMVFRDNGYPLDVSFCTWVFTVLFIGSGNVLESL